MKKLLFNQSLTVNFLFLFRFVKSGKRLPLLQERHREQEDIDFFDIKVFYELKVGKNNECPLG